MGLESGQVPLKTEFLYNKELHIPGKSIRDHGPSVIKL